MNNCGLPNDVKWPLSAFIHSFVVLCHCWELSTEARRSHDFDGGRRCHPLQMCQSLPDGQEKGHVHLPPPSPPPPFSVTEKERFHFLTMHRSAPVLSISPRMFSGERIRQTESLRYSDAAIREMPATSKDKKGPRGPLCTTRHRAADRWVKDKNSPPGPGSNSKALHLLQTSILLTVSDAPGKLEQRATWLSTSHY